MGAWDDFENTVTKHVHVPNRCKIGIVLGKVKPAEQAAIKRVLANLAYSHNAVAKAFKERESEVLITNETVGKHRRGECSCSEGKK